MNAPVNATADAKTSLERDLQPPLPPEEKPAATASEKA